MKWFRGREEIDVPPGVPTRHLVKLGWECAGKPVKAAADQASGSDSDQVPVGPGRPGRGK